MTDNETIVELFKILATCKESKVCKRINRQIEAYKVDNTDKMWKVIKEIQNDLSAMQSKVNSVSQAIED